MLNAIICAYRLPGGETIEEVTQSNGDLLWAVRHNGNCLNKEYEWEYEPRPSSRDTAFFARCRWETAKLAYEAWLKTQNIESSAV